jgi:hypothetical protein
MSYFWVPDEDNPSRQEHAIKNKWIAIKRLEVWKESIDEAYAHLKAVKDSLDKFIKDEPFDAIRYRPLDSALLYEWHGDLLDTKRITTDMARITQRSHQWQTGKYVRDFDKYEYFCGDYHEDDELELDEWGYPEGGY